jgi:TrmH family RNA methyltransferase
VITSLQNKKVKQIVKLHNARERVSKNCFIIEGMRELSVAIAADYNVLDLLICEQLITTEYRTLLAKYNIVYDTVSLDVFQKMAYRDNSDGIIAICEPRYLSFDDIKLSDNPIVIVLDSIEKPGNIGAILRTADAANIDAVLICNTKSDIYNPNTIRSSIGCVFSRQIVVCSRTDASRWLHEKGISIFATSLNTDYHHYDADFTIPSAIVMGEESCGLTDYWLKAAHRRIKIPMLGRADSLNVSVSTAIITFEAIRQRKFSKRESVIL